MPESKPVTTGNQQSIEIKPAKGRPFLQWVGKQPLQRVTAYPAQLIETYTLQPNPLGSPFPEGKGDGGIGPETDPADWPAAYPPGGLLFHGDNKEVLAHLLANGFRGKVKLIYIDPPFDSGADYVRKVALRGQQYSTKLEGEKYSLGEQTQYTDIWANDNYLQFMYERIMLLKELLSEDGTIFLHCDQRRVHHLRCLFDEVFGVDNFINEIIWQHQIMGGSHEKRFSKAHETLLWYSKTKDYRIRIEDESVRVPFGDYVQKSMKQDPDGRWYYERRRMSRKATPEEAASKAHTRTYVDNPEAGTVITDVWSDMLSYQEKPNLRQGLELYPTQKTFDLLTRVISAASGPGDLVLDCFIGSGTTAAVAQKLGRRWIGCDINKGAIQTTTKRLQAIIKEQADRTLQLPLLKEEEEPDAVRPAQLGFAVYRVNDYDLQIQHNEAVNLACEHLGVARSKTDRFFDGLLGKRLVKIIPFNHPLSPIDLEEIKIELASRPEESRDVVVVSLGKEIAADAWLEDWNRLRKTGSIPNKIDAIELRTDPRYGGFFQHQPAQAEVEFTRQGDQAKIEILNFISPSIVERLKQQSGVLSPQIEDWRSMVDSVMIDTNYDGQVFNISLADIPERKDDFVSGIYTLPVSAAEITLAVKITDMLGEEVLVVKTIYAR